MSKAIIIGAGPAGLTAASELLERSAIQPLIIEQAEEVGGLARTISHGGYKLDIGPHRFFSKSQQVIKWWRQQLDFGPDFMEVDRLTRIYFSGKFFAYPISLNYSTIKQLGLKKFFKIAASYLRCWIFPIKPEDTLEKFYINRFGQELYSTFFKDYTAKVWGVSPSEIDASWGAQRVKGLSVIKTVINFFNRLMNKKFETETSLIEKFFYPRYGSSQIWQAAADKIKKSGGEIRLAEQAINLEIKDGKVVKVVTRDKNGAVHEYDADYVISTMPIRELFHAFKGNGLPGDEVRDIAVNLPYRDLVNIGLAVKTLKARNSDGSALKDNWLYMQDKTVKAGRIQLSNNMSHHLSANGHMLVGVEYYANEGDEIWNSDDETLKKMAIRELAEIGLIEADQVADIWVERVAKAYPAYFGSYGKFNQVRDYLDGLHNLYSIGRNGMHRYNNMDHSSLTAMAAVDSIVNRRDKKGLWDINTDQAYHEICENSTNGGKNTGNATPSPHRIAVLIALFALANLILSRTLFNFPLVTSDSLAYANAAHFIQFGDWNGGLESFSRLLLTPLMLISSIFAGYFTGSIYHGMLAVNLVFYFFIALVFGDLVNLVYRNRATALLGALLLIGNFCLFSMGVTYMSDIGGWFFLVLTSDLALRYYDGASARGRYFYLAILSAIIGVFFKETGGLGIIVLSAVTMIKKMDWRIKMRNICLAAAGFLTPLLAYHLWFYLQFHYSYFDWYIVNHQTYNSSSSHTIEALAKLLFWLFNFGWLLFAAGIYQEIKALDRDRILVLLALLAGPLAFLFWPYFAPRIGFILVPWLALLASYGLKKFPAPVIIVLLICYYFVNYLVAVKFSLNINLLHYLI